MPQESFRNFASTSLVSPSPLQSTDMAFTVTNGQGALFPTANFCVTIDTEILFILSRTGDVFTVAPSGRGFDRSLISSHVAGSIVQLNLTAYNFNHLWENVADTFHPDVPPVQSQLGPSGIPLGTAGKYDTEFDAQGNWILYPTNGSPFSINTDYQSHLFFNRNQNDNALYTAYIPFSETGSFAFSTKISDAVSIPRNVNQQVECTLFVSDQTNPVASHDSGNRMRLEVVTSVNSSIVNGQTVLTHNRFVRASRDLNGAWGNVGVMDLPIPAGMPVYLRLHYNGANNWRCYVGDGYTYNLLIVYPFTFTPRSMGFQMYSHNNSSDYVQHMVLIDYLRFQFTSSAAYPNS